MTKRKTLDKATYIWHEMARHGIGLVEKGESKVYWVYGLLVGVLLGIGGNLIVSLGYDMWISPLSQSTKQTMFWLAISITAFILFIVLLYVQKIFKKNQNEVEKISDILLKTLPSLHEKNPIKKGEDVSLAHRK